MRIAQRVLAVVALAAGFIFIYFGLYGHDHPVTPVDTPVALPGSEQPVAHN